jgi:hypothetical protein
MRFFLFYVPYLQTLISSLSLWALCMDVISHIETIFITLARITVILEIYLHLLLHPKRG